MTVDDNEYNSFLEHWDQEMNHVDFIGRKKET